VAGPGAGGILAEWGADVVRTEPPEGDSCRTFLNVLGGDLPSNAVFRRWLTEAALVPLNL
jgi:crotonobetainyl-CoA:carnitine CoA-transferase CaiB-like acyl-CoA transferase